MIASLIFGAALGMRFKVVVLFPAISVSTALIAGGAAAHAGGIRTAALAMVLSFTGLQVGFLGGVATRFVVAAARASRLNGDRPTAAAH